MALLDVNALVALAWDSHVHHAPMRAWFVANSSTGWATCPITENGFVRVSSNPKVLPSAIGDVSASDSDVPAIAGYRQVTDAHLLTLARRRGVRLLTFDASIRAMSDEHDVEVLTALRGRSS
jgi:hypothetical protein